MRLSAASRPIATSKIASCDECDASSMDGHGLLLCRAADCRPQVQTSRRKGGSTRFNCHLFGREFISRTEQQEPQSLDVKRTALFSSCGGLQSPSNNTSVGVALEASW